LVGCMESTDYELTLSLRKIPNDRFLACISMTEQTVSREEHGYATGVCSVNDFLISD
jgi:hypothetical protein